MRCRNCGWENPDTNTTCEKCGSPIEASSNGSHPQFDQPAPDYPQSPSPMKATVREGNVYGQSHNVGAQDSASCPRCGYPISNGMDMCPACGTPVAGPVAGNMNMQGQFSRNNVGQNPAGVGFNQPTVNEQQVKHCSNCGSMLPPNAKFCVSCGAPTGMNPPQAYPSRPKRPFGGTVSSFSGPGNMGMNVFCTLKPIAWARERIEYQPISYTGERIVLTRGNTDPNNQTITSQEQASITFKDGEWYLEDLSANRSTLIRVDRPVKLKDGDIIMLGNRMFEFGE